MKDHRPRVLLTRPTRQSHRFLAECEAHLGRSIKAVISPIIEIVPTGIRPDLGAAQTIVVTSGNAVRILGSALDGRDVVTVGAATADLAKTYGARASAAGDTVQDLLANTNRLAAPVLVCRGVHARIDLVAELNARGIPASDCILYDQAAKALSDAARRMLESDDLVIAPVFSPRSAALLSAEPRQAPLIVPAISQTAADAWAGAGDIRLAKTPTAAAMMDLVTEAL